MQKQLNSFKRKSSEKAISSDFSLVLINSFIHLFIFTVIIIISFLSSVKFDMIYFVSLLCISISNLFSGMLSGYIKKQRGLLNGILFSLPSNVIFIILSLIINKFYFDYNIIISIITAILFSAVGGVISVNLKRKIKSNKIYRGLL